MGERRIRVGVIGAGTFAEEAHIPGIQAHRQGDVAALCARNQQRATVLAARLGVPDVYTDYHEMLARPDIDAVTIATPDVLHAPIALAALEAGKHVFCEKPLAMTVAQAEQMVAAATRADRIAMVGFTFRYTRALQTLRRLLGEGGLGTPFYVSMHVHWGAIGYPVRPWVGRITRTRRPRAPGATRRRIYLMHLPISSRQCATCAPR